MLRKSLLVPLLGCLVLPLVAHAQFEAGDFSLTLGGSGSNSNDWDGVTFTVNGELGYLLTKEAEIGVRQGISYQDFTGSAWNGATDVFFQYNFDLGRWVPYIGANIGFIYGDNVNDSWEAGPEGGLKVFVNSTTFIQLSVAYEFFFKHNDKIGSAFSDGSWNYGLLIGFRF